MIDREKGCLTVFAIGVFLLIVLAALVPDEGVKKSTPPKTVAQSPSAAALESEYAVYFEKRCIKSSVYGSGFVRTERWRNEVKQKIMGQAKRYDSLSRRKEIYEKHVKGCRSLINSGIVRNMTDDPPRWEREHASEERRADEIAIETYKYLQMKQAVEGTGK